jgi:hypothetical protein
MKSKLFILLLCIFCSTSITSNAQKNNDTAESEQRVFRDGLPDNQEVSAASSIDDTMNVITKGVGTASVQVKISNAQKYNLKNTVIIQLSNDTTGDIYELGAYYENSYTAHMNLPKGNYTVIAAMVVNDFSGKYAIPTGQEFSVGKKDSSTYDVTLNIETAAKPSKPTDENAGKIDKLTNKKPELPQKSVSTEVNSFNTQTFLIIVCILSLFSAILIYWKSRSGRKRKTNIF